MLLRDLKKVWISEYEEIREHGEVTKKWKYKAQYSIVKNINRATAKEVDKLLVKDLQSQSRGIAWLNLQQDVNELDRNSTGEVDYSIVNARTTKEYDIQKGNGISLTDISFKDSFVPDYIVTDCPKIGNSILYKLRQYNGEVEDDEY